MAPLPEIGIPRISARDVPTTSFLCYCIFTGFASTCAAEPNEDTWEQVPSIAASEDFDLAAQLAEVNINVNNSAPGLLPSSIPLPPPLPFLSLYRYFSYLPPSLSFWSSNPESLRPPTSASIYSSRVLLLSVMAGSQHVAVMGRSQRQGRLFAKWRAELRASFHDVASWSPPFLREQSHGQSPLSITSRPRKTILPPRHTSHLNAPRIVSPLLGLSSPGCSAGLPWMGGKVKVVELRVGDDGDMDMK